MSKKQTQTLGILGGGQLARMMTLAASPLGLIPRVLSESAEDPAALVCPGWQKGNARLEKDLRRFFAECDAVTFESEFFDMNLVEKVSRDFPQVRVFPRPLLMAQLQDRRTQKSFLDRSKIPTSPWLPINEPTELAAAIEKLGFPLVVKKAMGGYDGYGTFYIRSQAEAARFIWPGPCIAEKAIRFRRELALMIFRSHGGQIRVFPLVETQQTDSRCDLVHGPVSHPKLKNLLKSLQGALQRADYVGALGVELFDTGRELLVNELAPRVHNSGHYSQNALNFDQFGLHLLCGLRKKLPTPELRGKAFAMANLLGVQDHEYDLTTKLETALHWYGKKESRPGRKMGHLNACGKETRDLLRLLKRERKSMLHRVNKEGG